MEPDERVELVPYTAEDVWLTDRLETDPRVMGDLGGPWPREAIPGIHARRLAAMARGNWVLKVVVQPGGRAIGGVTLWHNETDEGIESEAGWMILPEHQGRGYAREAVRQLLARARADGRWGPIHAHPGVDNAASNAICAGAGFRRLGELDVDYGDRTLRCARWVLDPPGDR